MYGYDIPSYVREYARAWQRYDRFLRVRRSLDSPGMYCVERKTRYIEKFPCQFGTDRQVQYKDEYRQIYKIWPADLKYVMASLKATDIQAQGGAKALADRLDLLDEMDRYKQDVAHRSETEALASEVYDHLGWIEGRKIAVP